MTNGGMLMVEHNGEVSKCEERRRGTIDAKDGDGHSSFFSSIVNIYFLLESSRCLSAAWHDFCGVTFQPIDGRQPGRGHALVKVFSGTQKGSYPTSGLRVQQRHVRHGEHALA
jgi:hypothetical protein